MEALRFQRGADGADAPVHHVRRRDDVRSGARLIERLTDEDIDAGIVDDPVLGIEQTVVAVAGVRVERDVGQDADVRAAGLDRGDGAAHQIAGVKRLGPIVAAVGGGGIREQGQARDAECGGFLRRRRQQVDRQALDTGHRRDRFSRVRPLGHEQRPDEVSRAEDRFGHQRPRPGVSAAATRAEGGVLSMDHAHPVAGRTTKVTHLRLWSATARRELPPP